MEIDRPDESPLQLDGNAAGGPLCELFAFDMTAASITCDGCGTVSQVGELALYGGAMGAIFRCIHCDAADWPVRRSDSDSTCEARVSSHVTQRKRHKSDQGGVALPTRAPRGSKQTARFSS